MSKYGSSVAEGRPDLIPEWSPRNDKGPEDFRPGSQVKVWWVCGKGHEWEAPIDNRVYNNTRCPFCTPSGGRKLYTGFNDLETVNPDLAKEWHPTRNGDLTPSKVLPGTRRRVWWLCSVCDREWEAVLKLRHTQGTGCPSCRGRKQGLKTSGAQHRAKLYTEWGPENHLPLTEYSTLSQERAHWRCEKGHEWRATIGDRNSRRTECKQCGLGGTSKAEISLREFIESLSVSVRSHHRQIDPRFEYDVAIPEKKVVVEFNGLYWHTESKKGRNYHLVKSRAAEEAGWRLIHIWEDDWRDRRSTVEAMLKRKMGVSEEPRLNARSLDYKQVTAEDTRKFLEENHIQGFTGGSWRGGLYLGDNLVALMVFRSRGLGKFELTRFATSAIVRGGHSKLLRRFIEEVNPASITTFSDRGVSDGGLYERCGFEKDGELSPDYTYRVKNTRVHKFNYRKARFKREPNLKYEEGLTERELAELSGLERVYDAGKIRWVLNLDKGE